MAMHNFTVQWTPGKTHLIADALSRAPLFAPKDLSGLEIDTAITCLSTMSASSLNIIFLAIDEDYRLLLSDVPNGTRHSTYSRSLKADFESLSTSDGLVLLDSHRIVLPLPAVKPILNLLHVSHSGVNKTLVLSRGLYYWPGMVNNVKQMISNCPFCSRILPSQPFTPMVTPPPSTHLGYPMQHVGLDLFSFGGRQYLICVDHWSGYPLYSPLRSLSLPKQLLPSFLAGSTFLVGLYPLGVTVDLNSVAHSLHSALHIRINMNYWPHIIPRVMA